MKAENLPAPDVEVTLWDGSIRRLSEFWQERKLVLVFLRHLGWLFCREQVAQLRQEKHQFDAGDAQIVLVGMGTPQQTTAFKEKFDLSFPMLSDPKRELYHALEIGFMSLASTLSPRVAVRAASALFSGHGVGIPHGDIRQLPAVFIIDTGGTITHSHIGKDAADHPDPRVILDALSGQPADGPAH